MTSVKWFSLLALALLLLALAPVAAAQPPVDDDSGSGPLPPGLSLRVFVHYPKGHGPAIERDSIPVCSSTSQVNCEDYSIATTNGNPIRWDNPTGIRYWVTLNYNKKKSPQLAQSDPLAAIQASFRTWEVVSDAGLRYDYQGNLDKANLGGRMDGKNVVGWKAIKGTAIAITYVWYYTATGRIAEFDMAFNNTFPWSYTPPTGIDSIDYDDPDNSGAAGTYDLQNIGTHEAGHTLMLNDLYNTAQAYLTMYGYGSTAELKKDSLANGDVLGVQAIY